MHFSISSSASCRIAVCSLSMLRCPSNAFSLSAPSTIRTITPTRASASSSTSPDKAHPSTSIVYEYPRADGDPYYPVPTRENAALYKRYEAEADAQSDVTFVGRLATYKYYNMDQVVAQALTTFKRLRERHERQQAAGNLCAETSYDQS